MAYRACIGSFREMASCHDGVHGGHQLRFGRQGEHGGVIANPEDDAGLPGARRTAAHEKALNQFELAETGGLSVHCSTHTRSRPYSSGRNSRAARSNTALTNLYPSVAPNCLVNCTASASATRYGNSGHDSSS